MKPLFVLLAVFGLLLLATFVVTGAPGYVLAGNGAMAVM